MINIFPETLFRKIILIRTRSCFIRLDEKENAETAACECHQSLLELELGNQTLIKPFGHEHHQQVCYPPKLTMCMA